MNAENCRLVFTGRIVDGMSLEEVQENLAAIFKTDIEKIRQKFSEKPALIRKNIDEATCRKMQKRLLEAGAICEIEFNEAEEKLHEKPGGGDSPAPPRPPEPSANPYATPRAELKQRDTSGDKGFIEPQKLPAGRGAAWFFQAITLFLKSPFVWLLTAICLFLIQLVQIIPVIGPLAMVLLGPVFTAGLILGAQALDENDTLQVGYLFQGFKQGFGQLVLLGLIFLAAMAVGFIVAVSVTLAITGVSMLGVDARMAQPGLIFMLMLLMFLLMLAIFVPIMMGYWFVPALIAVNEKPVFEAIALSFKGCLRNILPFLIYSLVAIGITIAAGLLLVIILTAITLAGSGGAMWTNVILPVIIMVPLVLASLLLYPLSIYTSYKDIFYNN
ncbi:MAG: BPSS1780 family membrane protein [Desulfosalsimonas sp.]